MPATSAQRVKKDLPEGVDRHSCGFVPSLLSIYVPIQDASAAERTERFLADPLAERLPKGFNIEVGYSIAGKSAIVRRAVMTKKKRPAAMFWTPPVNSSSLELNVGDLFIALRGDRKTTKPCFITVSEELCFSLLQSICVIRPSAPCNLHPWCSSIVYSFKNEFGCESSVEFDQILEAVKCKKLTVVVVPPCAVQTETLLHKLAIDKVSPSTEDVDAHMRAWTGKAIDDEIGPSAREQLVSLLNSITSPHPVSAPAPVPAVGSKKRTRVVTDNSDEDVDKAKSAKKAAKKLIDEAKEASSKADEQEARNTAQFEAKVKRMEDSDEEADDASDKGNSKKKKDKSDSERSLSEDSEDSEDNDDSSDDSDKSETSESSEKSGESGNHDSPKPASRLVKGSDAKRIEPQKTARKPKPAHDRRQQVASQAFTMLDAVETCNAIPLGQTDRVSELVGSLRSGFDLYKKEKTLVEDSYALHTNCLSLCSSLVNALNSSLTPDQRGNDANVTRKLAVNTATALAQLIPALAHVKAELNDAAKAVVDLEGTADDIAGQFKASASQIED